MVWNAGRSVGDAEEGVEPDGNGKSDPYVRFELDDHKRHSTTQQKTLNATWNEKFEWLNVRARTRPCLLSVPWIQATP
jgi:Ca2+-dependent lipid-binding protein